ncbi:MAG: hypothetical protein LBF00_01615 [Mycoplasmataceae bacterium]|jgi:hypothetical protein|nr:hypothetical protein [Mycoplasmataceae bacterium]
MRITQNLKYEYWEDLKTTIYLANLESNFPIKVISKDGIINSHKARLKNWLDGRDFVIFHERKDKLRRSLLRHKFPSCNSSEINSFIEFEKYLYIAVNCLYGESTL